MKQPVILIYVREYFACPGKYRVVPELYQLLTVLYSTPVRWVERSGERCSVSQHDDDSVLAARRLVLFRFSFLCLSEMSSS